MRILMLDVETAPNTAYVWGCGSWSRERYRQKSTREMLTEAIE